MAIFGGMIRRPRALVLPIALLTLVCVWFHTLNNSAHTVGSPISASDAKTNQLGAPAIVKPRAAKPLFKNILARTVDATDKDFMTELQQLNEEKVAADDPRLIRIIKEHFIVPPSTKPYNLTNPRRADYSGQGKDFLVPNTVKNLPEVGFFIECGAYNGEYLSTSMYFEKQKHWSGLLVEANPNLFAQLQTKHRRAYSLNACLNTKPYPSIMRFNLNDLVSRLVEGDMKEAYSQHHGFGILNNTVDIQCFPLYSVLLALGNPRVDFMSLDTEGTELAILKTVPWDNVDIRTMLVEHSHTPDGQKYRTVKKYLESRGYTYLKLVHEDSLLQKKT